MATKNDLINYVSEKTGLSKQSAADGVDAVLNGIYSLAGKSAVRLAPLGTFEIIDTPERTARNPRTGEPVHVPAGRKLRLKNKKI